MLVEVEAIVNSRPMTKRNFRNGDIVLLKAETHRNNWPVARIIETLADKHGVGEQSD